MYISGLFNFCYFGRAKFGKSKVPRGRTFTSSDRVKTSHILFFLCFISVYSWQLACCTKFPLLKRFGRTFFFFFLQNKTTFVLRSRQRDLKKKKDLKKNLFLVLVYPLLPANVHPISKNTNLNLIMPFSKSIWWVFSCKKEEAILNLLNKTSLLTALLWLSARG